MTRNALRVQNLSLREVEEECLSRPFLKWAGGKAQLLSELTQRLPKTFERYFEPFVGGGALFFHLQPTHASLCDINEELINVYRVVKDDVEALIEHLSTHVHDEGYFYGLREADRNPSYQHWSPVKRASRLIYLNKTCYNGLYRVNSKGHFNVPFGDYRNPKICDPVNLRACSEVLREAKISCMSYLEVENQARRGDFVYFDPPYAPLTATANFTNYSKDGFSAGDQKALRDLCVRLDQKEILWMLSNSSAPFILELYRDFSVELVEATRAINSKGSKRGTIKEVVVTNYGPSAG